jgi:hypothetical protein
MQSKLGPAGLFLEELGILSPYFVKDEIFLLTDKK